jgi:hypothetical protein
MRHDRRRPLLCIASAGVMFALSCSIGIADEPGATTQPSATPPDKSQYTLFNPTPANQLRDMDTDRPNVTNTPHTIDAGHLQVETGLIDYAYYRDRSAGNNIRADDLDLGQFNFRLGVLNNLEFNAVITAYNDDRTHDYANALNPHGVGATTAASGFGDTVIGGKLNLWGDDAGDDVWASALAIQPQLKFATARNGVGNGHFEFEVAAPFLINLPAGFHLGLQPGLSDERDTNNMGDTTGVENSISVDRVVFDQLDVYIEYASDVTAQKHVQPVQTLDTGATYPFTDNIILDTGVAFGLNRASNTVEVLAGISVRF